VQDTLYFLQAFERCPLSPQEYTTEQLSHFFRLLLDTAGLLAATSGDFPTFALGGLSSLGTPADVAGILSDTDSRCADWACSTLFQGWARAATPPLEIGKDLRYSVPKGAKACDFLANDGKCDLLIECKRIHPTRSAGSFPEVLDHVAHKAFNKALQASEQFESSARHLRLGHHKRLLILDIAAYGDGTVRRTDDMQVVGMGLEEDIIPLAEAMAEKGHMGRTDELTLCWSSLYHFEGYPCTLVYHTYSFDTAGFAMPSPTYRGWTVEFFPVVGRGSNYRELRIAVRAEKEAAIRFTWLNLSGRLKITVGPEQRVSDLGSSTHHSV